MGGQHTYREILRQPDAWKEALMIGKQAGLRLKSLSENIAASKIHFTGCGSTYYLSLTASALARQSGLYATASPASETWLWHKDVIPDPAHTILVTVSRSGETSETLRAVAAFRQAGGRGVVTVTCSPESTLARSADIVLAVPSAQERSVAQTRSFTSMLIVCQGIVDALSGQSATDGAALLYEGRQGLEKYHDLAASLGSDLNLQNFFFLGSGPLYGLACEAMLKMKEMSLSHSEAYHSLEFRHGPKSMLDPSALVISMVSDHTWQEEFAVLTETRAIGARALSITRGDLPLDGCGDRIGLSSDLSPAIRVVLYLPILQLLAYFRAMAKHLDPDDPRHLTAVVTL
jgi:glucosamine--fructose-6-phosphate aminotransferase (isomerizing)